MARSFRDRDPVRVGVFGLLGLTLLLALAFRADDLPLIGGGDTYYAEFAEAGGLKRDDPVMIAGVRVGTVRALELVRGRVRVEFQVDGARFGTESRAQIKVRTMLGAMFLSVTPAGSGRMEEGETIPRDRTESPFQVVEAFSGLAARSAAVDTDQLSTAMRVLADLTRDTPEEFRGALDGVSRLSRKMAARDQQINDLLGNMRRVSAVLADRDADVVALMRRAGVLFQALVERRTAIHNLLVATARLSDELSTLVRSSRADLGPALGHLSGVVDVLLKNQDNLDKALRLYAPFLRLFTNVTGNGPWLDGYISNIPPVSRG